MAASTSVPLLLLLLALTSPMKLVVSSNGTESQDTGLLRIKLIQVTSQTPVDHILGYQFASVPEAPNVDETSQVKRMNMLSYNKFNFIGEIWVGRPARMFRVLLDSGSAELWLLTKECPDVDKRILATYDWTQSSSFGTDGRPVTINYVKGATVSGRLALENIHFGDLFIEKQTFIQVDQTSTGQQLLYYYADGILGLSLETVVQYPDVEPPMYSILREARRLSNGASKQMVSFSLNHGPSGPAGRAGELIIGGLDHSRYVGGITWTPLLNSKRWHFRVDSIELTFVDAHAQPIFNELTVCQYGCQATADTGTNVIAGNPRDVQMINGRIGAVRAAGGGHVLASCEGLDSRLPQLVVTISGRKFSLTPSQYTFKIGDVCYSGFEEVDARYHWILGAIFLGHFYTIVDYDNQRLGLAESPFKSEDSIIGD